MTEISKEMVEAAHAVLWERDKAVCSHDTVAAALAAALSRPIDPKAEVEPVAKQWRAVEYGEPRTSWNAPDRGDLRGWQAWAEGHNGYEIEWRDLYASPSIVGRTQE